MPVKIGKAIGEILVEENIISQKQLDLALKRQKQEKGKYLGQILFEMGIPQDKINKALDYSGKRKPLGQVLLDFDIISPEQLQEALEKQRKVQKGLGRRPLGILLVEMGHMTFDEYLDGLSKHFNMPIVSLRNFHPSPSMQTRIGEKYARKHRIIVWENNATKVKLVLGEPTKRIMEDLQKVFAHEKNIEFYLAHPYEVDSCFIKMFDPFSANHYR